MAVIIKHGLFKRQLKNLNVNTPEWSSISTMLRLYATKVKKVNPDKKKPPIIESTAESIAAKGFLRPQRPYTPPPDTAEKFQEICKRILNNNETELDLSKKFSLLTECRKIFNHAVPNSLLHTMVKKQDILEFYKTAVNTTVPLDMMKNIDLPENVHIQYEYHRFHPESDTMFNGVTAFPQSSTLVTGLKYRKKYRGFEARTTWPYNT